MSFRAVSKKRNFGQNRKTSAVLLCFGPRSSDTTCCVPNGSDQTPSKEHTHTKHRYFTWFPKIGYVHGGNRSNNTLTGKTRGLQVSYTLHSLFFSTQIALQNMPHKSLSWRYKSPSPGEPKQGSLSGAHKTTPMVIPNTRAKAILIAQQRASHAQGIIHLWWHMARSFTLSSHMASHGLMCVHMCLPLPHMDGSHNQ